MFKGVELSLVVTPLDLGLDSLCNILMRIWETSNDFRVLKFGAETLKDPMII